jgi:hypothetical protein
MVETLKVSAPPKAASARRVSMRVRGVNADAGGRLDVRIFTQKRPL